MTPKRRAIKLSWFFICLCFSKSLLIKCLLKMVAKKTYYDYANDVKGRQVATGDGDSYPRQQYKLCVKTWLPSFRRELALLN